MKPLSFSIANFKSFGSALNEIPLRPLTLIFGPNSAGKSSLLQALMYFHEAMESGELDVITPRAGKGKIDLGGFKQLLHRRSGMNHIILGFTYSKNFIPKDQRNWWPIDEEFTIYLTLGPLTSVGEMGVKGMSLEIDDRELLRASHRNDGPMKIDLFDFEHPAMSSLLSIFTDRTEKTNQDTLDEMAEEIESEEIFEYFNFAIQRATYHLTMDEFFPWKLKFNCLPDIHESSDDECHIRMWLFQNRWQEHLQFFMEDVLPGAFKALFSTFQVQTKLALASISHVPPLRDLPPRVFDLNQHPDPLWRRIANEPDLRKRINQWLGAGFMKTRYELQLREYAPIDEITTRVPDALDSQLMSLFQKEGFGSDLEAILSELSREYDEMDRVAYLNSHPELFEGVVDGLIDTLESWADSDSLGYEDADFKLLNQREKRHKAIEIIESVITDDPSAHPEVWNHFQQNNPELRDFLSTHWDSQKAAKAFNNLIIPANIDSRKEIALAELPSNIKVSLQDVGVGISQVLPVLMSAFGETEGLIAVEQPEIHIHPALQAELADVFIESALGENQNTFLLETHSEHLILRILRRIRETTEDDMNDWPEELKKACPNGIRPEDVAVLYVEPGEDGAKVVELPVDAHGEFTCDWPGGFFEERMKELF